MTQRIGGEMKLPEKIYLQWYGDGEPDEPGEVSVHDVTWHKDKVFKHDIEYVREYRIAELEAENTRLRKAIDERGKPA